MKNMLNVILEIPPVEFRQGMKLTQTSKRPGSSLLTVLGVGVMQRTSMFPEACSGIVT